MIQVSEGEEVMTTEALSPHPLKGKFKRRVRGWSIPRAGMTNAARGVSSFLHFLCYPQHPFVDVVSETFGVGQGNDDIGRDAKTFSREVFLEEF